MPLYASSHSNTSGSTASASRVVGGDWVGLKGVSVWGGGEAMSLAFESYIKDLSSIHRFKCKGLKVNISFTLFQLGMDICKFSQKTRCEDPKICPK